MGAKIARRGEAYRSDKRLYLHSPDLGGALWAGKKPSQPAVVRIGPADRSDMKLYVNSPDLE